MATKVVMNPAGVAQMLRDADLSPHGRRVLAAAKAGAPVLTGTYRASLYMEDAPNGLGVRVVAPIRYAIYVEADTGNLARSLDAAGGSI